MKFRFVIEADVEFKKTPGRRIDSDPIARDLNQMIHNAVSTDDFVQDFANGIAETAGLTVSEFYIGVVEAECTD
jgi:hypothetical protein